MMPSFAERDLEAEWCEAELSLKSHSTLPQEQGATKILWVFSWDYLTRRINSFRQLVFL